MPASPLSGSAPCADELHAVVLRRVVRGGDHGAAVEAARGDAEVEHLRGHEAEVAPSRRRPPRRRRRTPRAGPRDEGRGSMPAPSARRAELLRQGAADALGGLLVELLRVQAAHVVRLEDAVRDRHRPSLPRSARGTGWSCRAAPCSGYRQMPPARRLPAPTRQPSPTTAPCELRAGADAAPRTTTLRSTWACAPSDDAALEHRLERPSRPPRPTAPAPITASGPTRGAGCRRARRRRRSTGGTTRAPGIDRRPTAPRTRSARPARSATAVCDGALEDVEVRLQVALGRADVAPVAAVRRSRTATPPGPAAGTRRARCRTGAPEGSARGPRARARRRRR